MAAIKERTAEEKDRAKDKRLRKTYGITLDDYNHILAAQNGRCGICGRLATEFATSLNVDHVHFKLYARKLENKQWHAWAVTGDLVILENALARTKKDALHLARSRAMPKSVRGLLCPGRHGKAMHGCCNRLLGRVDNSEWLSKAIVYLNEPPAKKVLTLA
jgi:Recombination endonuclease VII